MGFLDDKERRTLEAICRTLVPAVEMSEAGPLATLSARDIDLADEVEEALAAISSPDELRKLRIFLRLLRMPVANGLLDSRWRSFRELSLPEREQILRGWMESRLNLRRQAFQAVKRLTLFLFYAASLAEEGDPPWSFVGYDPPAAPFSDEERPLRTLDLSRVERLQTEVLVVGSGAGGSVVAAELAAAGHDVLVLDKGDYYAAPDFHGRELEANAELFEKQGALTTTDLSMVVLAGSALGGGTVINWSTSLETPAFVRQEWAREYGFEGVDGPGYDESLHTVLARLHVDPSESEPNGQNRILERGARGVGSEVRVIPRNVDGCVDCTYCAFGCRYGAKQSSLRTFLPDAQGSGARIAVRAKVDRLLIERGHVLGASATVETADGARPLTIGAKAVVVCAGAVQTPALLMRSGLRNRNLGRHLRLHPVTAPFGIYEESVRSWEGPPQTRMVDALANMDGRGHGVRIEVAPAHPGLWASALPWTSGRGHKHLMSQLDHAANFIVIGRDHGSGRIALDRRGEPILNYRLAQRDRTHLVRGLAHALRMHHAAGAHTILSPHANPVIFERSVGQFEQYLERVLQQPYAPNRYSLFSAHQMGTARIGGSPSLGVVRPDGATWEIENLFVADGSVFPTACGVNPMVPIAATAHFLSRRIAATL